MIGLKSHPFGGYLSVG